ncbi:MAG: hypothetical protein JHC98_02835 [Thermoleophilaceae bacterium]|nr:hypothetical protein [Thermoleophilaceae bacterium]
MGTTLKSRTIVGLCCVVASLGFAQQASADTLPAPSILSGPAEGSTISTDSASFVFDYADSLAGATLVGFLCSLDGAPAAACDASHNLTGLTDGVHTLGVSALILPLGGEPVCVLTNCLTLPPVETGTDVLMRTFNVDLGGVSVGTPPSTTGGSSTTNNSSNSATTSSDRIGAFALAWGKYKRQQSKCNAIKKRIKKYRTHSNRMRAAKRYKSCVRTQKKLRAEAMALAN